MADNLFYGFEVGFYDGVFEADGAFAYEFAGVHVDGYQRFGVIDDDVAAGFQPDFGAQGFIEFVLDAELFEDGLFFGVELHLAEEIDIGANFLVGGTACGGAYDEASGIRATRFADQTAETRTIFRAFNLARDTDVIDGGHIDEEASG